MKKSVIISIVLVILVSLTIFIILGVSTYNILTKDRKIEAINERLSEEYPGFTEIATYSFGGGESENSGKMMIAKSREKFVVAKAYTENLLSSDLKYLSYEYTFNNNQVISNLIPDAVYIYDENDISNSIVMILKGNTWEDMNIYKEKILELINQLDTKEYFSLYIFLSPDTVINTDLHKALLLRNYMIYDREYTLKNANFLNNRFFIDRNDNEEKTDIFWENQFDKELNRLN